MLVKRQSDLEMVYPASLLYHFLSDTCQILLFKVDVGCIMIRKNILQYIYFHFNFEVFCNKADQTVDLIIWIGCTLLEVEDLGLNSEELMQVDKMEDKSYSHL